MSWIPALDPECQTQNCPQKIETIIIPRTHDIGGFEVRRALPNAKRRLVGPFIFFDQMGPGEFLTHQGIDVRPHPHIGLATLTYLLEGTLDHRDSTGVYQRITPGDVNLMTAGKGITHSERTGQDIREAPSKLFGIQSWLALPKNLEDCAPNFEHISQNSLPTFQESGVSGRLIGGSFEGLSSPLNAPSDMIYLEAKIGKGAFLKIPKTIEERALYVVSGAIEIEHIPYPPQQLLILAPKEDVIVKAEQNTKLLLIGGATL